MSNVTSDILNLRKGLIKHHSVDKDIAVENVIRQLRSKKNIEVKKVNNTNAKLKRIPPMHKNLNSEGADSSKLSLGTMLSKENDSNYHINEQRATSGALRGNLEIEDDEIEDYLEIDQNVVEDLEALIPEEEIVSISNSLIQPEEKLSLEAVSKSILGEKKSENKGIPTGVSVDIRINNSGEYNSSVYSEIKPEKEVEGKSSIDQDKKESYVNQKNSKQETSHKNKKFTDNDQKAHIAKKIKKDSGSCKKITDFFSTTFVKYEADSNNTQEIDEIDSNENQINSSNSINHPEIIDVDKKESEYTARALRSRSKITVECQKKKLCSNNIPLLSKNNNKPISTNFANAIDSNSQNSSDLQSDDLEFVSCKLDDTEQVQKISEELKKNQKMKNYNKTMERSRKCPAEILEKIEENFSPPSRKKTMAITEVQETNEIIEKFEDIVKHISSIKFSVPSNEVELPENKNISQISEKISEIEQNNETISIHTKGELVNTLICREVKNGEDENRDGETRKSIAGELDRKRTETTEAMNSIIKTQDKIQNKKKKRKHVSNYQNKKGIYQNCSEENAIALSMQKKYNAKLEIYNFDDKSADGMEVLQKPVTDKKRQATQEKTVVQEVIEASSGQDSKYDNVVLEKSMKSLTTNEKSKIQSESSNTNNNEPKDLVIPSAVDSQVHKKVMKKNKLNLEVNTSDSMITKLDPGDTEDFQENNPLVPVYGPYKRVDRCNVCLMTFRSYKKLRAHKKIHEVENPYKCNKCEESFQDVEKLAAHLRIHKGKMPFSCKKCDATFWTSMQLDKHQLVHVLKKPAPPSKPPSKVFKCEECGKEFRKISDLERHIRVHTGEKPSVCNICNKRFQQPYNLNKHLYTHTQEKNFECVICQKKFGRNDVLNRHVLTHSIVKPFKCSVCSKTFIRNTQLKLHLQKHHNLNEDPVNGNNDSAAGTSSSSD